MGSTYVLLNLSRLEYISFLHMSVAKRGEIMDSAVAALVANYYLLMHPGDHITYIVNWEVPPTMADGSPFDWQRYEDKTGEVIAALIEHELIKDLGRYWVTDTPEDEPNLYMRKLRFIGWVYPEDDGRPPDPA